jgi:hypothetical protein
MKTMSSSRVVAQQLLSAVKPYVTAAELDAPTGPFGAGEFTLSVYTSCCLIVNGHLPVDEELIDDAIEVGMKSSHYAPYFRELFAHKVA